MLAQWLVETATRAGYPAQSTSIPGVAQRTGATTYYVEVFPETIASLGDRRPVLSLLPVPGRIDLAIASELLEAGRIVASGMVSAERTTAHRVDEPHADDRREDGAGRRPLRFRPPARRRARIQREAGRVRHGGGGARCRDHRERRDDGRDRRQRRAAVRTGGVRGRRACVGARRRREPRRIRARLGRRACRCGAGGRPPPRRSRPHRPTRGLRAFPPEIRDLVATGHARLVEFQDAAYGDALSRAARAGARGGTARRSGRRSAAARSRARPAAFSRCGWRSTT